ncbi:MAG: FecR family protein [Petrimonas sp.]|nr:FecR family protein [Petrimonas sp.]
MIIKHTYSEKENIVFSKEVEDIISNTRPQWIRSKEDIWMEMEAKLDANPTGKKVQPVRYFQLLKYAAVASIALLVSFAVTATLYTKNVKTVIAEKSFLLPDNSKVVLHANSSLSYKPLLWKFSRTTKLNGEAYFEVESGSRFEVVSEKAKTVVLGTRFLVTARENEYQVNCEHGKVMLVEFAEKNEVVITTGQKARLKADKQFEIISQHHNNPTEVTPEVTVAVEEKDMNITEEKPAVIPKDEMKPEPERQRTMSQEKIQLQEPTPLKVEPNLSNELKENHLNEIKNLLDEAETKLQTENQERTNLQNRQGETADNNAEPAKNRFRNSLTQKQLDILEDKTLSRTERQKAFIKSLTNEQRQLLRDQNTEIEFGKDVHKDGIKENVKDEQRNRKNQLSNTPVEKEGGGMRREGGKQSPR